MEATFSELKCKQIINVVDGKSLGRIIDVVLDVKTCKILGLVVPNPNCSMWSFFKTNREIFIPFTSICKIGLDVILVELYSDTLDPCPKPPPPLKKPNKVVGYSLPQTEIEVKKE